MPPKARTPVGYRRVGGEDIGRAPVVLPANTVEPQAGSGLVNVQALVQASQTETAVTNPYTNTDTFIVVPDTYLAFAGGGAALAARLVPLGPVTSSAEITLQAPVVFPGFDGLQLTVEGFSATASSDDFFALFLGLDDGNGSPTPQSEQFAGYFYVSTVAV